MKSCARNWDKMKDDILVIGAPAHMDRINLVKINAVASVICPAPVVIHRPDIDPIDEIISQKDKAIRLYDFDRIHLESQKQNTDRRERVRFQNINARVQSKIAQRTYQNKKQKGR